MVLASEARHGCCAIGLAAWNTRAGPFPSRVWREIPGDSWSCASPIAPAPRSVCACSTRAETTGHVYALLPCEVTGGSLPDSARMRLDQLLRAVLARGEQRLVAELAERARREARPKSLTRRPIRRDSSRRCSER